MAMCAFFLFFGGLITANIFGELAVIISMLSKQSSKWQNKLDTASTAMKNMNLPVLSDWTFL